MGCENSSEAVWRVPYEPQRDGTGPGVLGSEGVCDRNPA